MSPRQTCSLALLVAVPALVVVLALWALSQISAPAALLAALAALPAAMKVAQYLARDVGRLRDRLRERSENPMDAADPASGMLRDINGDVRRLERHWHQQHAAQSRRIGGYLAMLDSLPDPVLSVDEQGIVGFANAAARALLGGDSGMDDPTGRALSSLLRQPGLLAAIGEVINGEPGRQIEVTLTGQVDRFVEAWVEPLTSTSPKHGPDQIAALVVIRDMTVVRRGEGVRANFVANVSHELRTPLASLLGFIETLRGPAADDRAAQTRFLALMDEQAARMARLVDDLLSLSRIEMNAHQLPATKVALPKLLRSLAEQLAPQAAQPRVTVTIIAADNLPAVQGDADDLARLFQNLIENSIKYGRENSEVAVTVMAADNDVTVTVADQGEGIAPEHLPRLTERFYRVDAARSRALGGTGLGLAIVKHIVNRHQGHLKIESEAGMGSRFIVSLPLAAPSGEKIAAVTELQ